MSSAVAAVRESWPVPFSKGDQRGFLAGHVPAGHLDHLEGHPVEAGPLAALSLAPAGLRRRPSALQSAKGPADEATARKLVAAGALLRRTVERMARSSLVIIVTHRPR